MSCDFDRIDELLRGSLTEQERLSLLAHMESCPACRAYYEVMAGLEGNETVPAGFSQRVMEQVRTTPQRKARRIPYRKILSAAAACAVLAVTLQLLPLLGSSTANDGADGGAPKTVVESQRRSGGDEAYDDTDGVLADSVLPVHIISDEALCAQVREYLANQGFSPVYGYDAPREAYDLTAEDAAALNRAIPGVSLPEQMLQLELKSAK